MKFKQFLASTFNKMTSYDPSLTRRFRVAGRVLVSKYARDRFHITISDVLEAQQPGLKVTSEDDRNNGTIVFDVGLDDNQLYALTHAVRLFSLDQDSDRRRAKKILEGDCFSGKKKLQIMIKTAFESAIGGLVRNPKHLDGVKEVLPEDWASQFTIVEEESDLVGRSTKGVVRPIEEYGSHLDQYAQDAKKASKDFGLRW